jgi:hypothetical protein
MSRIMKMRIYDRPFQNTPKLSNLDLKSEYFIRKFLGLQINFMYFIYISLPLLKWHPTAFRDRMRA